MKFHDELNPIIWDKDNDNQMRPEVLAKLKEIANAFIEYIEIPEDAILDIVVTGSSASYNYNKYSDLDLHIIVDYDKIHEDCPLVEGYLGALKNTFNKEHDIFIKDVPVELYAEKKDQGTVHNGLYSVQEEEWIDKPEMIPPTDNDAAVEAKYQEIKDMVDKCDDSEAATGLLEKIYNMRKAGLAEAGEFCTENLAFKKLRNEGCMDKLRKLKKEQIDKQLSLESYNESLNEDITKKGRPDNFYKFYKIQSPIVQEVWDDYEHGLTTKEQTLQRYEEFLYDTNIDERDLIWMLGKDKWDHLHNISTGTELDAYDLDESIKEDTQRLNIEDFKIEKTDSGLYKVAYDSRIGYIKPDKSYAKVQRALGNAIYKYNTKDTQANRKALMSKLHKLFKQAGIPKMKDMTTSIRGYRPITKNGYYMDIYAGDRTSFIIGLSNSNEEYFNTIKQILDKEGINYSQMTDHFDIDMEKQDNKNESIKESWSDKFIITCQTKEDPELWEDGGEGYSMKEVLPKAEELYNSGRYSCVEIWKGEAIRPAKRLGKLNKKDPKVDYKPMEQRSWNYRIANTSYGDKNESINEGQSIKKWAESMLPEIYKILRKNQIPSKDYCVLGHVEICPNANFLVRKTDVEKVLELLPMAKENEYWDTDGNAASIRIEYDGLREFEKTLKSVNEYYEEDDCEDIPEEMHKERYVTYFETQEGRQKYTIYHVYTDSTDDSYNELCDKRDNQLGMYNSYKELKDALKEKAEKVAKQQGWTVKSIENLGEDEAYYRERNKVEFMEKQTMEKEEMIVDEDLATLEKKVDQADKDIQDMITQLKDTNNESIIDKLDKVIKIAEEVNEPGIDTHQFKFKVNDDNTCYLKSGAYETQIDDIDYNIDKDELEREIEDALEFEVHSFYIGGNEDEITSTEIVGFKYNTETKEGEFEFNIFFEE